MVLAVGHVHSDGIDVTTADRYLTLSWTVTYSKRFFGSLEVACWPLVPKFAGSNPAEAVGFFRAKKPSARLPSEGK